jgi:hypothetical protein
MGKKKSGLSRVAPPPGAIVCTSICALDRIRRYELAVEAFCQLSSEVLQRAIRKDEAAPSFLIRQYWRFSYGAWGEPAPEIVAARPTKMNMGKLLWLCLTRVIELTDDLVRRKQQGHWQLVRDVIIAWRDAWGDDETAKFAQARFSTLTGLSRGSEERITFMNSALIKALSEVQA